MKNLKFYHVAALLAMRSKDNQWEKYGLKSLKIQGAVI